MAATATKSSNNGTNGTPRRTLASQIDRLDEILDGLGEALNESITAAVQKAVEAAVYKAVQCVMTEVLTNPEVQAMLQAPSAKPADAKHTGGFLAGVADKARRTWHFVCAACSAGVRRIRKSVAGWWNKARQLPRSIANHLSVLRRYKSPLLVALGVGILAGVGAYYAGPWLASLASGVCGFFATLAVQAFGWMRGIMEQLRMSGE